MEHEMDTVYEPDMCAGYHRSIKLRTIRRNPDQICWSKRSHRLSIKADALNNRLAEDDHVCAENMYDAGAEVYFGVKDDVVRSELYKLMVKSLKTNTNLISGEQFHGRFTLTKPLMKQMVRLAKGESVDQKIQKPRSKKLTRLTDAEVETLGRMKASAIKSTTPQAEKSDILALYIKLTGI